MSPGLINLGFVGVTRSRSPHWQSWLCKAKAGLGSESFHPGKCPISHDLESVPQAATLGRFGVTQAGPGARAGKGTRLGTLTSKKCVHILEISLQLEAATWMDPAWIWPCAPRPISSTHGLLFGPAQKQKHIQKGQRLQRNGFISGGTLSILWDKRMRSRG